MNTYKVIEFVEHRQHTRTVQVVDAFELRRDRPAVWLQRLCLWVLAKLKCYSSKDTVTVTRHLVDGKTFMERLFKQKRALTEGFGLEPKTLLIGGEDYQELMGSPEVMQFMQFSSEYRYGRNTVVGLEVKVIPWMRGLVVMP